ncbi:hypothetical protein LCGC14_0744900 [marine sediment metagenome]|uniref:Uncharacterized protein n=1 Tax=marine sediment metagenome TaxID=412755 RepID=A0A0F9QQP6_9ZZZZ
MTDKNRDKEGREEDREENRLIFAQAAYNTPPERMAEMTILSRKEVSLFAVQEMFDAILEEDREPGSLNKLFRESLYRHRRSLDGEHLVGARQLAEVQLAGEYEDDEEDYGKE